MAEFSERGKRTRLVYAEFSERGKRTRLVCPEFSERGKWESFSVYAGFSERPSYGCVWQVSHKFPKTCFIYLSIPVSAREFQRLLYLLEYSRLRGNDGNYYLVYFRQYLFSSPINLPLSFIHPERLFHKKSAGHAHSPKWHTRAKNQAKNPQ